MELESFDLLEPPQLTWFDVAVMFLHMNLYQALICRNPDCPAPYFLGTKKGQKYCTQVCSHKAQIEYKRQWWSAVGSERRKDKKR